MIRRISVEQERYDTRMYCNLVYANPANEFDTALPLHMHLICPRGQEGERFPLLIYVGGGGWRVSNPDRHLPELAYFATKGFVIASIEYRTTATDQFPNQIEDVKTAVRYLRKNCDQFGIDPDRIFMAGGSAGAYLTAMAALTGGTELFRGKDNLEVLDAVNAAVCFYGVFDMTQYFEPLQINDPSVIPMQLFLPQYDMEYLKYASPVTYVKNRSVPFLLLHGTADRLVPHTQSVMFHDQLEEWGNDVQLYLLENADHADRAFGQPCIQEIILDFLNKNMEM